MANTADDLVRPRRTLLSPFGSSRGGRASYLPPCQRWHGHVH